MARTTGKADDLGAPVSRPRGRPKVHIDLDAVADAVAELFAEGGYEAVNIINTAEKLSVSRATLYRTVPTKDGLLGILFERSTAELTARAQEAIRSTEDPRQQLFTLIDLQANAAVSMRAYMPVFFGSSHLPADVVGRWHRWSRRFEAIWVDVIERNMAAGVLAPGDPRVAARLVLGMLIWVSRWYRPREAITPEQIAATAHGLLGLSDAAAPPKRKAPAKRRTRTAKV